MELMDSLFEVQDPHPDVFDLLTASFHTFCRVPAKNVARTFELKLFQRIGWLPELTRCVSCGTKQWNAVYFSARHGGLLCEACDRDEIRTIPLSRNTVQTLQVLIEKTFAEAAAWAYSVQTEHELERVTSRFLQFRLEYPLNTPHFLNEISEVSQFPKAVQTF